MNSLLIVTTLCLGQTYQVERGYQVEVFKPKLDAKPLSYNEGRALALKTGKDLVIGVACDPPSGDWVSARSEDHLWDGTSHWAKPYVVVSENKGDWLGWLRTLSEAEADANKIGSIFRHRREQQQSEVRRQPEPFRRQVQPTIRRSFRSSRSANC